MNCVRASHRIVFKILLSEVLKILKFSISHLKNRLEYNFNLRTIPNSFEKSNYYNSHITNICFHFNVVESLASL